ncbi:MAG: hypothetical protein RR645_07355 [Clostridium sp.]
MTMHTNDSLENKKIDTLKKKSAESRNSKTGYMEAGNEQKFKRRG